MNLLKQLKRANYLENVFYWKKDKQGNRYRDTKGMIAKKDMIMRRMAELEKQVFMFNSIEYKNRYRELRELRSLLSEINLVLSGEEITIRVPCEYRIEKTIKTTVPITLTEYHAIMNQDQSEVSFYNLLIEKEGKIRDAYGHGYVDDSLEIMDLCF